MFSSARNNRCAAFFPPKLNYRQASLLPSREGSLSKARLKPPASRERESWDVEGNERARRRSQKWRRRPTARSNSGANFEGPFFPRRGTSTAAENYPARTTQSYHGRPISWPWANRVQTVPLVGLIAPHHFRTSERSTSLLRDFYPDAIARRAASRIKLEGVSSPRLRAFSLKRNFFFWGGLCGNAWNRWVVDHR